MKVKKTNAMRHLDTLKLPYEAYDLQLKEAKDAQSVADLLKTDPKQVFKTLVTITPNNEPVVFMIPANAHLSLKKAAHVAGKKKLEMLPQKQLFPLTGYVHGGCSPLGMKKHFPTYFDQSALDYETIYFSGGKIGVQIQLDPRLLAQAIQAKPADLCESPL